MNFYLTVGNKYRLEKHPLGLHPDGWARVIADDFEQAIKCVNKLCGFQYANLYKEDGGFDPEFYPRGELVVLDASEVLS